MMRLIKFNHEAPSSVQIKAYYDAAYRALELKHRIGRRRKYGCNQERTKAFVAARTELSIEAGFMLLAYVEKLFRSDFAVRIQIRKNKDSLTTYFRSLYKPAKPLYQYRLNEDIIFGWRKYCNRLDKSMEQILQRMPQYFDYRNWIAHGRYWKFKEENYVKRYNFESICLLVDEVEKHFSDKFVLIPPIGDVKDFSHCGGLL